MMNYLWRFNSGPVWMGYGFNCLFILLIVLILIFALAEMLSWLFGSDNNHNSNNTKESSNALNIVKERYAKGEITKEQFEQLKKDL